MNPQFFHIRWCKYSCSLHFTLYTNQNSRSVTRGVTRGDKRGAIPRAPCHYGGAKSLWGAPNGSGACRKVPTISQVLSSIQYICFRKTSVSNMGRQTCFLPRVPANSLRPCHWHITRVICHWADLYIYHTRFCRLFCTSVKRCPQLCHHTGQLIRRPISTGGILGQFSPIFWAPKIVLCQEILNLNI